MSEQEKEAALAFARSKPIEWDEFLQHWLKEHPTVSVELAIPEEEPKTEKEVEDDKLVEEAEEE